MIMLFNNNILITNNIRSLDLYVGNSKRLSLILTALNARASILFINENSLKKNILFTVIFLIIGTYM